jgi:hypothetical protein
MDSSDDDVRAGWPSVFDGFTDDDTTLNDWMRINRNSGLPVLLSTSWAPLPSAHFSGSAYLDDFGAAAPEDMIYCKHGSIYASDCSLDKRL